MSAITVRTKTGPHLMQLAFAESSFTIRLIVTPELFCITVKESASMTVVSARHLLRRHRPHPHQCHVHIAIPTIPTRSIPRIAPPIPTIQNVISSSSMN